MSSEFDNSEFDNSKNSDAVIQVVLRIFKKIEKENK